MESPIVIITIVVVVVLFIVGTKLTHEMVQTVTVWDYQTGLHFRHGRFVELVEPGKHRYWGRGHRVIVEDSRISELVVQGQEVVTSDSATVKLSAVAQWKIADPVKFHLAVEDARQALYTRVQMAMRRVFGRIELDKLIERTSDFGRELLADVKDGARADLGIEVLQVELRDLMLSGELKASYASVLTARKAAQAQQEKARGDAAAMRTFANAARVYRDNPELIRLRYLETLEQAGAGYGNQLIIGVPEEFLGLVKKSE